MIKCEGLWKIMRHRDSHIWRSVPLLWSNPNPFMVMRLVLRSYIQHWVTPQFIVLRLKVGQSPNCPKQIVTCSWGWMGSWLSPSLSIMYLFLTRLVLSMCQNLKLNSIRPLAISNYNFTGTLDHPSLLSIQTQMIIQYIRHCATSGPGFSNVISMIVLEMEWNQW